MREHVFSRRQLFCRKPTGHSTSQKIGLHVREHVQRTDYRRLSVGGVTRSQPRREASEDEATAVAAGVPATRRADSQLP